jgi:hypothetical protein
MRLLVGAVGIEHDPIFLSPAITRRCNRLTNPSADSADSRRLLLSFGPFQKKFVSCQCFVVVRAAS